MSEGEWEARERERGGGGGGGTRERESGKGIERVIINNCELKIISQAAKKKNEKLIL